MSSNQVIRKIMAASVDLLPNAKESRPRRQPAPDDASILSQKVYASKGYAVLFRTYVSRMSAGKGRALLEKLGLSPETVALCYSKNQDEEGAVQEGLYLWKDDAGCDSTWEILVEAMLYAGIGVQYVEELKDELYQNENVFAPFERQASVQAANPVLQMCVSEDDASLAAVLMGFLKLYTSGQSTPSNTVPPIIPTPATAEPSSRSPAVCQSDGTTPSASYNADSVHVYRMSSTPRGLAVIINNMVFTGNSKTRFGSEIDGKNLFRLFKWLGYEVKLFTDLTAERMMSTIRQLAHLDHTNMDSVVLGILTHGTTNGLRGADEEEILIENVLEQFNGYNSPTLVGKPKILFIQANRGDHVDYGVDMISTHPHHNGDSDPSGIDRRHTFDALKTATEALSRREDLKWDHEGAVPVLPAESDFVIVYSTPPGYVSWRNSAYGTWFISAFVDVMFEHAAKCHFLEILTFLNNRLGRKFQSREGLRQITETTFRLMKLLYFNPPSPHPPMAPLETDKSDSCVTVSDPADPQWTLPASAQ